MGKLITAALVVAVIGLAFLVFRSKPKVRDVTDEEEQIRQLVHEVHGENITSEEIRIKDNNAVLFLTLKHSSVVDLEINLSSLARQHKEGVSLPVLKLSLKFD